MPKAPSKAKHPLEPTLRELVDQVTIIADTVKTKPPVNDGGPPPTDPPGPVSPPPPPPPLPTCDCSGLCEFVGGAKPAVKSSLGWNPDKAGGAGWDWFPV